MCMESWCSNHASSKKTPFKFTPVGRANGTYASTATVERGNRFWSEWVGLIEHEEEEPELLPAIVLSAV